MSVWRTVLWGFLGIRRGQDMEADTQQLSPVRVIAAGLTGVLILILLILGLVWLVTR